MGKGFEKQAPREATDSSIKSESMVVGTGSLEGAGAGDGIFVERSAKDVRDISKIRPLPPPSSLNPNLRRCARREMIQEQPQLVAQYLWVSVQTDRTW